MERRSKKYHTFEGGVSGSTLVITRGQTSGVNPNLVSKSLNS